MLVSLCCAGVLEWQTGKTKDLVSGWACGFKSHLPQKRNPKKYFVFFRIFCYISSCILVHACFFTRFPRFLCEGCFRFACINRGYFRGIL